MYMCGGCVTFMFCCAKMCWFDISGGSSYLVCVLCQFRSRLPYFMQYQTMYVRILIFMELQHMNALMYHFNHIYAIFAKLSPGYTRQKFSQHKREIRFHRQLFIRMALRKIKIVWISTFYTSVKFLWKRMDKVSCSRSVMLHICGTFIFRSTKTRRNTHSNAASRL